VDGESEVRAGHAITRLTVRLTRRFTADMDALRGGGWVPPAAGTARDEFDARSHHVVVSRPGLPLGMVRITMADPSVLAQWSSDKVALPRGPGVAELTRGVVAPSVRRLGIYRLAMLETVLRLRTVGAWLATAAVEPEFPGRAFLAELGFVDVGRPVVFDDAPRSRTLAQAIMIVVDAHQEATWETMWRRQVDGLLSAGYEVDSDLWPAAPLTSGGRARAVDGAHLLHHAAGGDRPARLHGKPRRL
jgi:hypothetical protein